MADLRFGWIPQQVDVRDKPIALLQDRLLAVGVAPTALPRTVDLRVDFPVPSYDQGDIGSCVANAVVGAAEFLGFRDMGHYHYLLSRLALYYDARAIDGLEHEDAGSSIRDGIKAGAKVGLCGEWAWPYVTKKYATKPPAFAYRNAATHLFTDYYSIPDETRAGDVLQALAAGYPVILGFRVYVGMRDVGSDGLLPMPHPGDWPIGGHAVLLMGYDLVRKLYLVRNSWGPKWGDHGHFWAPFDYFNDPDEASDFWLLHKAEGI